MFKVLPQQLPGTLTTAFEIYFTAEDFTDMDQHMLILILIHANSFLGKYEMKMGEGAMAVISCTKIRACSLKNIAPRHFTYYSIVVKQI